jgi:DNA-binding transcriptional ArsR family regulator
MRRDVFQAISDPTRRQIIQMISSQPLNINAVSGNFGVSRTAIYKHIKILTECGLISLKRQGRERFCQARLEQLSEVSDWVEQYRKFWMQRLDALEDYLQVIQRTVGQSTNQHLSTKNKKNAKGKPGR